MGSGNGSGGDSGNIGWSVFWFVVLIFVGFWVAGICSFFYIIGQPFSVCISGCGPFLEIMLKGLSLPKTCTEAMMAGKSFGEVMK